MLARKEVEVVAATQQALYEWHQHLLHNSRLTDIHVKQETSHVVSHHVQNEHRTTIAYFC